MVASNTHAKPGFDIDPKMGCITNIVQETAGVTPVKKCHGSLFFRKLIFVIIMEVKIKKKNELI